MEVSIMNKTTLLAAALCLGAVPAIGTAPALGQENRTVTTEFINTDGATVGTATLRGGPEGVLIELEVSGLPAGEWLGFHVHETGECDPGDDFESAGEHFDPGDREHGYFVQGGPHAGDMPNQYVGTDGVIRAHVFNGFVRLGEGETDLIGRTLVIHADADDYASQPTGEAGDRLACAVVE
jgi:superoxide dismutase, Cu-Zn family